MMHLVPGPSRLRTRCLCLFRTRPAEAADRRAALDILPAWLDLPPEVRAALPDLWAAMDGAPVHHLAMEDLARPPATRLQGWGVTMALPAAVVHELDLHGTPAPHVARRVYQRLYAGSLQPMSDREIGRANARGELTLLNLHFSMRDPDPGSDYAHGVMAMANDAFRVGHAGFRLAAMYFEGGEADEPYVCAAGFRVRPWAPGHDLAALPLERRPRYYGLTAAQARHLWPGTSVRAIFDHQPPRFVFSATQRRLLLLSLHELDDETLSRRLAVSAHGLKKLWRGIYDRIEDVEPAFFGGDADAATVADEARRGPEKRRHVLAWVRQRPEELRAWVP